jgi:hypothetical protein
MKPETVHYNENSHTSQPSLILHPALYTSDFPTLLLRTEDESSMFLQRYGIQPEYSTVQ